jgi:WD40 repeat protein
VLTGHRGWVRALVVAPDGSWLASAGIDGKMRIWDLSTGVIHRTLTGHCGSVGELVVAPDGSWLASAGGDVVTDWEVRIWDPTTGTALHTLPGHTRGVRVVAPDGSWLASAGDREVRIWNPATGAPLTSLRVAGRLSHLASVSTTIVTAGEHGPYFLDGSAAVPLLTTRVREVLPRSAESVRVDEIDRDEAAQLLTPGWARRLAVWWRGYRR